MPRKQQPAFLYRKISQAMCLTYGTEKQITALTKEVNHSVLARQFHYSYLAANSKHIFLISKSTSRVPLLYCLSPHYSSYKNLDQKLAKSYEVSILEEKIKQKPEFYPFFCSDETTCQTLSCTGQTPLSHPDQRASQV